MKLFTKSIWVAFTVTIALTAQAQTSSYGSCNYSKQTVADITCYGPATIDGTTVTGTINVFGPLTMKNVTANDVIVKGPLTMNQATVNNVTVQGTLTMINASANDVTVQGPLNSTSSTVKGQVSAEGPVEATYSTFEQSIFSASNSVTLSSSQVIGNVTEKSSNGQAVLKMIGKSVVSGNVEFSGQAGQVILDNQSKVVGSVVNGTK
jgi:hypothetical protein